MKYSQKAAWIIEAMVVLLLLTVWVTGVYSILVSSQKLSQSTSYRIEAIQIARDSLEAMTNIRDTNWVEFWGDVRNCWNTWNYDRDSTPSCIWDDSWDSQRISHTANQSFILYRDEVTWKFELERRSRNPNNFSELDYRDNFRVYYDDNWFYTQSWSLSLPDENLLSREYTREIRIDYLNENFQSQWSTAVSNPAMDITVLVQWADPAVTENRSLEMTTRLTNWRDRN